MDLVLLISPSSLLINWSRLPKKKTNITSAPSQKKAISPTPMPTTHESNLPSKTFLMYFQLNFLLAYLPLVTSTIASKWNQTVPLPGDQSTECPLSNSMPCEQNSTDLSRLDPLNQAHLHMAPLSFLSRKRMGNYACASTTAPSTRSPRKTDFPSPSLTT